MYLCIDLVVLGIEPWASHELGKYSATELHRSPKNCIFKREEKPACKWQDSDNLRIVGRRRALDLGPPSQEAWGLQAGQPLLFFPRFTDSHSLFFNQQGGALCMS